MSAPATRPLLRGVNGVLACGHTLGVAAGLRIYEAGGGAVDAAVAAAGVLAVVMPEACGVGGDAMLVVRCEGEEVAFNGSGAAPATIRMPIPSDGAATAAIPGAVAAWEAVIERFGRLPLATVLAPAHELASGGFAAGSSLLGAVERQRHRLERGAAGWELLEHGLRPGALLRQPRLADLLGRIRREGSRALYEGAICDAMVRRVAADGGTLTAADLASHAPVERAPVVSSYLGARLALQPPVSQALLAGMVLQGLERTAPKSAADRAHCAVELVEAAFTHRHAVADPAAEHRLLATPLSFDPHRAARRGGPRGYAHTTAVAAADAHGTVISMLVSVFDDFGSAALVPEGGFLLNDRLTGFSDDPASPNAPAAGRRPVHTLAPALIDDGEKAFALATPGADGQVQILVQLLDTVLREGCALPDALDRPRWRSLDGHLAVEHSFPRSLTAALERRGHALVPLPDGDALFGAAAAAGIDRGTGTLFAAADPRRETWAGGW